VRLVDIGQQIDVRTGVARGELGPLIDHRFHPSRAALQRNQARDLRSTQSRHPREVSPDQSLAGLVQARVLEPYQRLFDPTVHLLAPLAGEPHLSAAGQEVPNLLQAGGLCVVHADDQSPASRLSPSGSSCVRIQSPVQAHLA
jgi:hypothetical protein